MRVADSIYKKLPVEHNDAKKQVHGYGDVCGQQLKNHLRAALW
jgi:hypothetical protein